MKKNTYHINKRDQINWIKEKIETVEPFKFSKREKYIILERLCFADFFERFLSTKYPTTRRFGLEGSETTACGLKEVLDTSSKNGVESFVIGMPHRGRLNVLQSVLRKPVEDILREFKGVIEDSNGSGDVKYHLGISTNRILSSSNKKVHLALLPNPSHLEAINPVVQGKVKAKQFYSNDATFSKNLAILLHGDAAFAGQGVNYETFELSDLPNYTTGGIVYFLNSV